MSALQTSALKWIDRVQSAPPLPITNNDIEIQLKILTRPLFSISLSILTAGTVPTITKNLWKSKYKNIGSKVSGSVGTYD